MKWTVGIIGGMVSGILIAILVGLITGYGVYKPAAFFKLFLFSLPFSFFIMTRASSLQKTLGLTSFVLSIEGFLLLIISLFCMITKTGAYFKALIFFLLLGLFFAVVFGILALLAFAEKGKRENMIKTG